MAFHYAAFLPSPDPKISTPYADATSVCFPERSPDAYDHPFASSSRLPAMAYPSPAYSATTTQGPTYQWSSLNLVSMPPQRPDPPALGSRIPYQPHPFAQSTTPSTSSTMPTDHAPPQSQPPPGRPASDGSSDEQPSPPPVRVREKRHGCWMCHKSFDRPSTLKKHLLVHTGEKAYACDTCGRRFGVASNLNRHARKCVLRPANARAGAAQAPGAPASASAPAPASTSDAPASASADTPAAASPGTQAQSHTASSPTATAHSSPEGPGRRARTSTIEAASGRPKRRRRAPSPAPWVPTSLLRFDITPLTTLCAVPLAPVQPYRDETFVEERNSYDEGTPGNPYHPEGWKGRLPGPGVLGSMLSTGMTVSRLVSC